MDAAGRKPPSETIHRPQAPARIAGLVALVASAVLTGVGTALPWLTQVATLPAPQRHTQEVTYTFAGIEFGNGWFVIFSAALLAVAALEAAILRRQWIDWLVLLPVAIGGLSLGHWLGALNRGGSEFPIGVGVSLAGILLATPTVALLHRGRVPARLAIAAATLVATGVALLLGALLETVAPISVYRTF